MSQGSTPLAWGDALEEFALFRTLSSEQRLKAFRAMVRQDLMRGQMLVAQGDPSDALFMVLHGALASAGPANSNHSPNCAPANWSAKSASLATSRARPM